MDWAGFERNVASGVTDCNRLANCNVKAFSVAGYYDEE